MDTASLVAADRRLRLALQNSDVAVLDELLDDAALYVGPLGEILDKQEELDTHRAGIVALESMSEVELRVQIWGATGVTRAVVDIVGFAAGHAFSERFVYTRTWLWENERWRVVAAHNTARP